MLPAASAPVLCAETLYAIRPATLARFFRAFGAPRGLAIPDDSSPLHISAIEDALVRSALTDDLAERFAVVEAFACDAGRIALYEAARALSYAHAAHGWRSYVSAADQACGVVCDAASDEAAREVLDCASIRMARSFPHRTWYQFVARAEGDDARAIGEPTQYLARLMAASAAWTEATDRGPWQRWRAFGDLRKCHFEYSHEDWAAGPVLASAANAFDPTAPPSLGIARPIRSHLVSYDAPSARLFVWTAMPNVVLDLVEIFAREVFGDPDFFFATAAVSLDPLQERSLDGKLPTFGAHIARSTLIGFTWDSLLGHTLAPRGTDALAAARAYGVGVEGGALRQATIRAETAPGVRGPRSADLAIRPPYTVTCSEASLAAPMLREADELGVTRPSAERRDWWRFAPHKHTRDEWRGLPESDELVRRGAIVDGARGRHAAHPRHKHAGRVAAAYAIGRRGMNYAVAEDRVLSAFLVSDAELVVCSLDWAKVATWIAGELALSGGKHLVADDGMIALGALDLPPTRAHVLLCTRAPTASALDVRRKEASPEHAVFVVPDGRALPKGFAHVGLASLAGPYRALVAPIVRELGLQNVVSPTLYAPKDARLVLHRATKQAYFDGVLLARVNEAMFNMLHFFATNAARTVSAREIAGAISAKSDYDALARKTIAAFDAAVVASFRAAKVKAPKDARRVIGMEKHGQYRLGVTVFVV